MKKALFIVMLFGLAHAATAQITFKIPSFKKDSTKAKTNSTAAKKDTTHSSTTPATTTMAKNNGSNSSDQLDFVATGCTGNTGAQTVTLYFTIANPVKVNQTIFIGTGPGCKAFDEEGDLSKPKACTLANGDGTKWTELPTGLTMKGSLTFSNILPKETQLAIVQFNIFTKNSDGGGDQQMKAIYMKNVSIIWQ
jgi:hypothetical protein